MFSFLIFLLIVVSANAQKTFDWGRVIPNYDYRCTKTNQEQAKVLPPRSYVFNKNFNTELKCNAEYIELAVEVIDKSVYATYDSRDERPSKDAEEFLIRCVKDKYGYLEMNQLEIILVGGRRLAIRKINSNLIEIDVDQKPDELFELFVSNDIFNILKKFDLKLPSTERKKYCDESNMYRRIKYYISHCSSCRKSSKFCQDQMKMTWLCMNHLTYAQLMFEPPVRDLIIQRKEKSLYVQEQKPNGEFGEFKLLYTI